MTSASLSLSFSERLHRRTILGSLRCPILHFTYDTKLPRFRRQSYAIKTLAFSFSLSTEENDKGGDERHARAIKITEEKNRSKK